MDVSFLTPLGAIFGLAVVVPLAVFRARERRARRIRAALGLSEPPRRARISLVVALVAVCGLLALAAAQPVIATARSLPERTDAQLFVVIDSSRSMLASTGPDAPTRFERAGNLALRLRDGLPEVPVGLASMTDRLLPHLFPTTDRRVFAETLADSMGIERPPPKIAATVTTTFDSLAAAPKLNYFAPTAEKRVLLVLTDGESRVPEEDLATAFRRRLRIETIFVRLWGADELIYNAGVPEIGYRPDSGSAVALAGVASAIGGEVFAESDVSGASSAARRLLGVGETVEREHEGDRRALMPFITLAAVFPLGLVLFRRNL